MSRDLFLPPALEVAPTLLGSTLSVESESGTVAVRITEVEAYHGVGVPGAYDAGSHARDRKTDRNASMFGPPGHIYVYLSYGVHYALNMVCSPEGVASGVLIRAGEVVEGVELAQQRRLAKRAGSGTPDTWLPLPQHLLARGPGNLASTLGVNRANHDGLDLFQQPLSFAPALQPPTSVASGPRVGVSGEAGSTRFSWRFWVPSHSTVSAYRPGKNVPQ